MSGCISPETAAFICLSKLHERQLNTHVIELLAKGDWIDEPNNLLITGGAGAGKRMLHVHFASQHCIK